MQLTLFKVRGRKSVDAFLRMCQWHTGSLRDICKLNETHSVKKNNCRKWVETVGAWVEITESESAGNVTMYQITVGDLWRISLTQSVWFYYLKSPTESGRIHRRHRQLVTGKLIDVGSVSELRYGTMQNYQTEVALMGAERLFCHKRHKKREKYHRSHQVLKSFPFYSNCYCSKLFRLFHDDAWL